MTDHWAYGMNISREHVFNSEVVGMKAHESVLYGCSWLTLCDLLRLIENHIIYGFQTRKFEFLWFISGLGYADGDYFQEVERREIPQAYEHIILFILLAY